MDSLKIKSIGIITHRGNYNYGGLLQALALQRWLSSLGFYVEIINLNRMPLGGTRLGSILRAILDPINTIELWSSKRHNRGKYPPLNFLNIFTDFQKDANMRYSVEVTKENIGEVANEYDAIIIGSDQVWVYKYARPLIFFAHWNPQYDGRIISYAACTPRMHVPWYNKQIIINQLLKFYKISVRDTYTMKWVESLTSNKPLVVADPTLLYDFNEFNKPNEINQPYIFTYCLGSEIKGGHSTVIKEIRKQYGDIKIIGIAIPNKSSEVEKFADEVIYNASPQDWLNLLRHATFVYTDSFHGCIFSLKYNKQFIAYYAQQSRASRLIDIKERYRLENAIVSSVAELQEKHCLQLGIDYKVTNSLLDEHVNLSKQFLMNSLCLTKE